MRKWKAGFAILFIVLLSITSASMAWADAPSISAVTGGNAQLISPVITGGDSGNCAAITPVGVASMSALSSGITTNITSSDLSDFINTNNIKEIELITGLGATGNVNARVAPQLIVIGDDGKPELAIYASGGQMRMDKKVNGSVLNGRYSVTKNKATAIDFVDLRLQFKITLPQGVNIKDATWNWTVRYNGVTKTVRGVNYLRVAGEPNTYTSNVVITNIPISSCQDMQFCANINLSFVHDGITYTIKQPNEWYLGRTIKLLTNQYRNNNNLDSVTKAYVNAVYKQMDEGIYTPVA